MRPVLVLNADMNPISVLPLSTASWEDAIKQTYLDNATVVEQYENWFVRSQKMAFAVPSVISVKKYVKPPNTVNFSTYNVYLRDDFKCQYCNLDCSSNPDLLTKEHVKPRFHGGKTTWNNILSACKKCNSDKGHKLNYKKPKTQPKEPSYWTLVENERKRKIYIPHSSWIPYLGWTGEVVVDQSVNSRWNAKERDFLIKR